MIHIIIYLFIMLKFQNSIDLSLHKLELLYKFLKFENKTWFQKCTYFDWHCYIKPPHEIFEWDISLLYVLEKLNIVKDIIDDINWIMEQSFYIDKSKLNFLIKYKKEEIVEDDNIYNNIWKINEIGFDRVYMGINLDKNYKIRDDRYFVNYIYYLDNKVNIDILEKYINEKYSFIENKLEDYIQIWEKIYFKDNIILYEDTVYVLKKSLWHLFIKILLKNIWKLSNYEFINNEFIEYWENLNIKRKNDKSINDKIYEIYFNLRNWQFQFLKDKVIKIKKWEWFIINKY